MKGASKNLVTIGTFDGVHRGHQELLARLLKLGRKTGMSTRVLMFARPPRLLFHPGVVPRLLTTPEERTELILRLGVDGVKVLQFDRSIADQRPEDFFLRTLVEGMNAGGVLVGHDFCFGKDRAGTVDTLARLCAQRGMLFEEQQLVLRGPAKVSSTRIRVLLDSGRVERAAKLLGHPYSIVGRVAKGRGLGSKLGFPTANLEVPPEKLLPPGVFAARATWEGRSRKAAVNIGTRPTVDGAGKTVVEAHLPRFKGDLAGKSLRLELLKKLRDEQRFPSLDALKAQLAIDVKGVRS